MRMHLRSRSWSVIVASSAAEPITPAAYSLRPDAGLGVDLGIGADQAHLFLGVVAINRVAIRSL